MTSKVTYEGGLRTSSVHINSGNSVITDAPMDNNGKGEAFSPTDLVATSLAACMATIMGIKANDKQEDISGITFHVKKVMDTEPRRISEIHIDVNIPYNWDDKQKEIYQKAALTCPVAKSLDPQIKQIIKFHY